MRAIILSILLSSILSIQGQDLLDRNWTKFHIERLDGSKIVSRINIVESPLTYNFHKNGKVSVITALGQQDVEYAFNDSTIAIGDHQLFQIDILTDSLLILIELPVHPTEADRINKIYFQPLEHYSNTIISKKLVQFKNDSTIISNKYLQP